MSDKILISGASSIIGKPLAAQLINSGSRLVEISRQGHGGNKEGGTSVDTRESCRWDMTTQRLSETSLVGKKDQIQTLIHCAPIWLLPNHLSDLIDLGIKRIIVLSSTSIDGKSQSKSPHEQHIVKLLKESEAEIWQYAKVHNVDVTVFRPTMIYGYGQGLNLAFIAKIIQRLGIFPMVIGARGLRRPVHADDLVNAICLALPESNSFGKTYALSGKDVMTYEEMVRYVFVVLGKKPKIIKLPLILYKWLIVLANKILNLPMDPAMADRMQEDLDFDYSPAQVDFGYSPNDFLPNGIDDILTIEQGDKDMPQETK